MKKRIYLLQHNFNPYWIYVGATKNPSLHNTLNLKFNTSISHPYKLAIKIRIALRCSQRTDWSIEQLHDFTEDWKQLEAEYIKQFNSCKQGLNSTLTGRLDKPVVCSNGITYTSALDAAKATGASRSKIAACCKGKRKTTKGYTWRYA